MDGIEQFLYSTPPAPPGAKLQSFDEAQLGAGSD
jgi:hypothetical protein